jgi:hypothetical protein
LEHSVCACEILCLSKQRINHQYAGIVTTRSNTLFSGSLHCIFQFSSIITFFSNFFLPCIEYGKGKEIVMTTLLEKAFEKASQLPDVEQNALAKQLLEELEAEKKWEEAFAESEDILDTLAEEALEEQRQGKTRTLNIEEL